MADREINVIISVDSDGAISQVNDFQSAVDNTGTSAGQTGSQLIDMGSKIGHVGASAFVMYDRLSIAQNAVENAQIRQTLSQERLTAAVARYGASSAQATKAQQELDIATRGVEIAQQRELVRMTIGIAVVIPNMIKGIRDLVVMSKELDIANLRNVVTTDALTGSRLALLAATGVGLVAAVGIGAMIAGGAFNVSSPSASSSQPINVYGDVHVNGGAATDVAKTVKEQANIDSSRQAGG